VDGLGRLYGHGVAHPGVLFSGIILGEIGMPEDMLFRRRYRIPSARRPGWDYRWDRFWDDILHTPADLERVRAYIRQNPTHWKP
jgi:hypothetical protein